MAQQQGKHPNGHPQKNDRVNAEARRYQMLELTKAGATERQIADTLGVARSLVHRDLKKVLQDLAKAYSRTADSVRAMQMERYSSLLFRWWQPAMAGDEASTRMVLQIMQRIDIINGIIPDKPLIDMSVTQTVQVGGGMGLMELARYIANGDASGRDGVGGDGPEDRGQSDTLSNGRVGGESVPEAD